MPRSPGWAAKPRSQRTRYQTYAAAAAELGLRAPEDRVLFDANRDRLAAVEQELAAQYNEAAGSRTELTMTRTVLTGRADDIKAELTSLQSRRNLLPLPQLEIRRRLCDGTGVRRRSCRSPVSCCASATAKRLGRRRRTHPARLCAVAAGAVGALRCREQLGGREQPQRPAGVPEDRRLVLTPEAAEPGTLAAKIAIKQGTPFRDFLLDELASRFDYFCCDTLEDFRRHSKALTANGQLKGGRGRHEKDDRKDLADRRNYVLGWDNQDKISRFRPSWTRSQGQLQLVAGQLAKVDRQLGDIGRQNQQLGTVRSVADFAEISWELTARRIEELKEERRAAGIRQRRPAGAGSQGNRADRRAGAVRRAGRQTPAAARRQ